MSTNILVTGGAGFIGSHIVDGLINDGHNVHIMDNLSSGRMENIHNDAVLHNIDIRSSAAQDIIAKYQYKVIFHQAAQMSVRHSVADPHRDADINIQGTLNLLEAGKENGLQKFIYASTGGVVYGKDPEFLPQDESHPIRPTCPYAAAKLSVEKYLYYYHLEHRLDAIALRYANVYGPRQNPHGEAGVIAIFAEKMLNGEQPVIYGDGDQTRDFIYVNDVVRANLMAMDTDGYGIYNIGTGQETSINEIFDHLNRLTKSDFEKFHQPGKPGEQRRNALGSDKAANELNWQANTQIAYGLKQTVDWYQSD